VRRIQGSKATDMGSNLTETKAPLDSSLNSAPTNKSLEAEKTLLRRIVEEFCAESSLNGRLYSFSRLVNWTRLNGKSASVSLRIGRVGDLLSMLEADAGLRVRFQRTFHAMLGETQAVGLFAEAGLHLRESLWSELARRVVERILPSARADADLSKLVFRLHPDDRHISGFLDWPVELFRRMVRVLSPDDDPSAWNRQSEDIRQAAILLGTHVAGVGLSPEFRERCHPYAVEGSPFYRVQRLVGELVRSASTLEAQGLLAALRAETIRCCEELEYMHERMEQAGVSTALEFDMFTIERALRRLTCITDVLFSEGAHSYQAVKKLLDDVLRARFEDLSLSALVRENAGLLARKIVERTGKTGEHYIANTRDEYWGMWGAALGGGLLTVATAAIKLKVSMAGLPPFFEGLLVGTDYAISFLVLQTLGLALATKQPSMTAATYAKIVRATQGSERWEKLTEFVSRITRTQLAAALGNLLTVTLGGIVFAGLWLYWFSAPFMPVSNSQYVYRTLNPLASGTCFYAALTGMILWISALAGGWVENFATYNRLGDAIADHPLGVRFGFDRMRRVADIFERNISGWSASIVLGYSLGFVPALGHFFGVPLEVRHVTLSTGTLALAATSLGEHWLYRNWFFDTLLGIAIIFVLNLGVSFGIASWVALRAYDVPSRDQLRLLKYVIKSFFRSPWRFLYPTR
jgi:site-specific recombinase